MELGDRPDEGDRLLGLVKDDVTVALNRDLEPIRQRLRIVANEIQEHRFSLALHDLRLLVELVEQLEADLRRTEDGKGPRLEVLSAAEGETAREPKRG